MDMSVCLHVCMWPHAYSTHRGHKRAWDSLRLELQTIDGIGVGFGIEHGFSAKATIALNH